MSSRSIDSETLRNVVEDVLKELGQSPSGGDSTSSGADERRPASSGAPRPSSGGGARRDAPGDGVFQEAGPAVEAAAAAQARLVEQGVEARARAVEIVKSLCETNAREWGRQELEETRIGRLDHKIEKLQIVRRVPGPEWFRPYALSGDRGITLEEYAPFGVIGGITPSTHSIPTLAGNVVNMVAAGNAVVFNPHPGAAGCAATAVREFNRAIERELGIRNLITTIERPSLESFDAIKNDERVRVLTVTGGPAVVSAAMRSGKRAICAGPGNPPVVVDETAEIDKAAQATIHGAAYDNNLLCIGEKAVFVVDSVADAFLQALERHGGRRLNDAQKTRLAEALFRYEQGEDGAAHPVLKRDLVGKDVRDLARAAGFSGGGDAELLVAETEADDVLVAEEQMAPVLPVVRVPDFESAVEGARKAEHGFGHSAIIHSNNVARMTYMARALDTSLFVKNGSSVAGLGLGGEGYLSYSIATTTGEGITNPGTFTRVRRCVMVDNLRIH